MPFNPASRVKWGPGPWDNEPDRLDWVDPDTGYQCQVVRGPVGAFCGYVGVPKDHPAFGIGYDPFLLDPGSSAEEWWGRHVSHWVEYKIAELRAHGGLTFSNYWLEQREDVKGDVWYFGFDCAHAFDLVPGATLYMGDFKDREVYRDINYVKEQCTDLARQLREIEDAAKRTGRKVGVSKQSTCGQ